MCGNIGIDYRSFTLIQWNHAMLLSPPINDRRIASSPRSLSIIVCRFIRITYQSKHIGIMCSTENIHNNQQ
jgi:hypothetical protein